MGKRLEETLHKKGISKWPIIMLLQTECFMFWCFVEGRLCKHASGNRAEALCKASVGGVAGLLLTLGRMK